MTMYTETKLSNTVTHRHFETIENLIKYVKQSGVKVFARPMMSMNDTMIVECKKSDFLQTLMSWKEHGDIYDPDTTHISVDGNGDVIIN